jgi:proteasome lid subunit RPN8/RPN11
MATPKDLLDYAGERLYRNSLDDVLDQIQQDIENERAIEQARQNIIVNDPDPVKKLREVQSIEKSVVNEPPEVQRAVLDTTYQIPRPVQTPVQPQQNRFMLPPDGTQPTIGQPRGVQQNLSDDDLRFRAELERIQEPFDRIFQEKLKTAKEIPGRNVTDPISGASYTVPGSTKEQIAKQKTIEQLEKDGVIKSQGFRNFLTTAIPLGGLSPEEQAQQTFFPARTALAQLGGAFAGLGLTSQAIRAPKIAQASYDAVRRGTKIGNFLTQKGINTVKAGKFTASATTGAGTFGAFRAIDQIDEDAPIEDKAKTIVEDAIFGAGFGLTGSLNNPATRSLAEGTFGFVTSKLLEGATTQEALLNGLLFAGFGVLNKRNMSDVEKGIAINEFKKVGDDSFRIIQDLRKQAGQKPFTKLQEKQWKKARDEFSERFRYEKYSPEQVKADTEEFITRFLQTNDPKGSIARIRQLGNQAKTQSLQAKAKTRKEAVDVPTTGKADKVSQENVLRLSTGEQLRRMKGLGYTEDQFVRFTGKQRQDILDNNIREENFVTEQPTRPSMPVPGPAPDVTPSTKKSDKLVPKKLEPKPKEVKPEVKPTKGEATGLKTVTLKPSNIKIDESKFQPREEYNQAVIDDIAKNFDPKKWDEPVLYQDPKTNEYIVVSGHHRHRGVVKGGYGSATYKVLPKGTTIDDAINMSEEGNLARTEQSSFENSKVVRRRFDKGNSLVDIANALPGLTKATSNAGKSNAVRKLLNLSYLDNKGSLKSNYDSVNEFPKIQSTSSYVGGLRKQYDWMTDKYEDDIFTYLYTENGIRQDDADWKLNIDSTLEKLADMKERPGSILKQLRKDPLQPKEGTSDEVLTQIKDIKKSIDNIGNQLTDDKFLQREIDRIQTEKGLTDVDALQEVKRDLRKRRAELKTELKALVDESSKPDPDQATMFDDIEQYNMFGGTDILKEVSKKDKKVLDELHQELASINKEQFFLTNQVSQNKINKLKARQQQKELDKRYEKTIKKIQKIDKPVNGATAKPGFVVDFNEQIKLNLQNKKQTELFREKASKEDKENTKKLTSEVSRLRSRLGITTRATNILEPLEKVGASHFIGQRVKSPEELAVLAQVARDRRFETFYILYTNRQADGTDKIVQYTAVSNKMPGWVNPFYVKELGVYRPDYMTGYMYEVMRDSGADGYYLLHNHPSSVPYPSKGDLSSTTAFTDNLPGFRAHVIINTKDFGYILPSKKNKRGLRYGMQELSPYNQIKKDPLYDKNFDKLNMKLDGGPGRIPDILKNFADNKNVVSVFATNYNFQLNALVDIPIEKFLNVGKQRNFGFGLARLKAQIRKIARDYGGQRIFLVTNRVDGFPGGDYGALERVFRKLYKDNFITEGFLFADYAKPELGQNRVSNRTSTWKGKLEFGESTAKSTRVVAESNYRGAHTAPSADYGAPGHDLTEMYPDDIYGPNGARYYGHGGFPIGEKGIDQETINILNTVRGKPDKIVTIYRAVPKDIKEINPGDWVTVNKKYAKFHGKNWLDNNFTVLSKKVPAREIYTDGNSIHEFGWNPQTNVSPSQTKSPEFKKWFKKSKAVDENGKPEVLYHGTTQSFDVFDIKRAIPDADLGKGFYFTNNIVDVNRNYGNIQGPDLQNKIERIAERNDKYGESDKGDEKIIAEIEKNLAPNEGNVMPVYLSLQNPVDLGEKGTFIEPGYTYDEELDDYIEDENSIAMLMLDEINRNYYGLDAKDKVDIIEKYNEIIIDGIYAKDLISELKKVDAIAYMDDDNGDLIGNDFISDLFAKAGFDGFIVPDANKRFNMDMVEGTTHYIVFDPTQIKSAIGNRGTFDPDSPSIIEDDIPAIKIKPHKQLQKEAPKVPKKVYDDARNKVEGKSRLKAIVSLGKTIKKEFKEPGTLNRILTPLSTRLRVLAPELKRAIRRFEFNVAINTAKDLQVAENFMKQTDKLRKKNIGDYTVLDLAMKNSDLKTAQDILDKHDMGSEFIKVRNMLDNIYARAEMVGYEPNYLSDYFPRKIKDSDGLMNYLYESDSWGVLQSNIKAKEKELGRRLEKDERLKLINNLIRGFGGRLGIQRPANLKEREIEYLNTDLNEFYYDSNTALHRYIVQMNEAIEIKRFFGKGMGPQDPNVQVDNNVVGEYVDTLLDQGVIKPNQQDELINLLRIRFAQGPMDPRIAKMRSGSYLLTMGQLSSAVTQIGDLAWSIYSGGLTQTGKALGKSVVRKSAITKKDIGIDKIAQEFTEVPGASKILDRVFTLSGLNYIDSLGKEALINSTIGRYQKQARKGKFSSSLQERLDEAFSEKELPKVIEDLKSGNITDDIKYLAHYTLSDFQPVSLSEMPEYYLKAPNGRIMYMLKSYQVKQFNVIRDEAFKKMNQGKTAKEKTEGVRRLIYLASVLMLTGMTADKIKNFMYGREQELDEMVTDNLLRLFGFNKYLVYVQKRYKNWAYTALKFMAPPVFLLNPLFESAMQDLDKFYRTKKKGEKYKIPEDVKTVKNLPLIGKFYYEYFGPGKEYNMKRKEKEQKKGKKKKKRPTI